jgi:predicted alpha/beta-fold hydrolase
MLYTPHHYGFESWEDLWLTSRDQTKIHAWFIKDKNSAQVPTVLFFHGNAGSILFAIIAIIVSS